jgi:hypothetical protein
MQSTTDSGFTYAYAAAVVQLIGNFLQTGLRAPGHDLVQRCDVFARQRWWSTARIG